MPVTVTQSGMRWIPSRARAPGQLECVKTRKLSAPGKHGLGTQAGSSQHSTPPGDCQWARIRVTVLDSPGQAKGWEGRAPSVPGPAPAGGRGPGRGGSGSENFSFLKSCGTPPARRRRRRPGTTATLRQVDAIIGAQDGHRHLRAGQTQSSARLARLACHGATLRYGGHWRRHFSFAPRPGDRRDRVSALLLSVAGPGFGLCWNDHNGCPGPRGPARAEGGRSRFQLARA